ncbi:MAG: glucokinase [Acidiferrobacteraceae bacterium]
MHANHGELVVVGDIGGTKTDLAVVSTAQGPRVHLARRRYHSADHPDLQTIVAEFLATTGMSVRHACFDVAGPVVDGRARLTNLPWAVDESALRAELNLRSVRVLNDLSAIAHAVPFLSKRDLATVHRGMPQALGALAVIAPGTGLGEAFLVSDGAGYRDYPSEGGHADFAPPTPALQGLLPYLLNRFDHVSYELVCSGIGIPHLYEFLRDSGAPESETFAAALAVAEDQARLIIDSALGRAAPSALASAALDAFVTILGAEASNLALKVFATGGVFLAGGIPWRILPALKDGRFMAAFLRKGRFSELLDKIPVHVIVNPDVALIGAGHFALRSLAEPGKKAERSRRPRPRMPK